MRNTILLTAMLVGASSSATAVEVRGTSSTLFAGRSDARNGEAVGSIPIYELFSVEVGALKLPGADDSRVVMQGWGRLQLGDDSLKENSADLGLLYLDARRGALTLRLGRQHLVRGVGRMSMIDGLDAIMQLGYGVSTEAFAGFTVHPELRHRTDNWQTGGRLAFNLRSIGQIGELGIGYVQQRRKGEIRRHDIGADAFYAIGSARVVGTTVFSPDGVSLSLVETRLAATYRVCDCLSFTVDGEIVSPEMLLPFDSIFSVFSKAQHNSFGGEASWRPNPYWVVDASGHALALKGELVGYRATLRGFAYREAAHRSLIGAEFRRLDEDENGYLRGRLLTGLQLLEQLRVTADLYLYRFDTAVNDTSNSVIGQASVVYDLSPSMRLAGTLSGGTTPWASSQVEGMLRFAYGYQVDLGREVSP